MKGSATEVLNAALQDGRVLLASSPSEKAVNRDLPSLLNLRVLSRALGSRTKVIALAGNRLQSLGKAVSLQRPSAVVMEFRRDEIRQLAAFAHLLTSSMPRSSLIVVGAEVGGYERLLKDTCAAVIGVAHSPILAFIDEMVAQSASVITTNYREIEEQKTWERRRLVPVLGCPPECAICPRGSDEPSRGEFRSAADLLDEIDYKIRETGTRHFEIVGSAWGSQNLWATNFLDELIRYPKDIRLSAILTLPVLNEERIEGLLAAGCEKLTIRCGKLMPAAAPALRRALKYFISRGRQITCVLEPTPSKEAPYGAAKNIVQGFKALSASAVHVLPHEDRDICLTCHELLSSQLNARLSFNLPHSHTHDARFEPWVSEVVRCLNHLA